MNRDKNFSWKKRFLLGIHRQRVAEVNHIIVNGKQSRVEVWGAKKVRGVIVEILEGYRRGWWLWHEVKRRNLSRNKFLKLLTVEEEQWKVDDNWHLKGSRVELMRFLKLLIVILKLHLVTRELFQIFGTSRNWLQKSKTNLFWTLGSSWRFLFVQRA